MPVLIKVVYNEVSHTFYGIFKVGLSFEKLTYFDHVPTKIFIILFTIWFVICPQEDSRQFRQYFLYTVDTVGQF